MVTDDGKNKRISVSRLILSAFKPESNQTLVASHIDGDKYNNLLSNLKWSAKSEVSLQAAKMGKQNVKIPVILKIFENDKFVDQITCESISECVKFINEYLQLANN